MSRYFEKALILGFVVAGCGDDGSTLDQSVDALGGLPALQSLQTITIDASGKNFDPGQGVTPERSVEGSTYSVTHSFDMRASSARTEWEISTNYFFPARVFEFTEIAQPDVGYVDGIDGHVVQDQQTPMLSTRTGTIQKQERLSNPLSLLSSAAENSAILEERGDREHNGKLHAVLAITDGKQPIEIFIDPDTHLPAKAETLEDDPVLGDVVMRVIYEDWRETGGIMLPFVLTHQLGGKTIRTENRGAILVNPALASESFDVPEAMRIPRDDFLATWGELSHAYFRRWQGIGLPFYFPQSEPTITPVTGTAGVFWLTGGSHHSMVIEMDDHLILAEAPLYELRSSGIIAALEQQFPDKPVRHVVATHHHHDHIGGARTFAAAGASLVIPTAIKSFVDEFLAAPHSLVPDALENAPASVDITTVSDKLELTDGTRTIEVLSVPTEHTDGMLVVWLPAEGIMFTSDMYSPGLAPPGTQAAGEQLEAANELIDFVEDRGLAVETFVGGHGFAFGTMETLKTLAGRN